jgi:propanol-preferring alcohol dehydrogenase
MRAMVLTQPGAGRVEAVDFDLAAPGPWEVSIRVLACGVCRTDLHVVDGDLPEPAIPVVPGHEIVGRVEQVGKNVTTFAPGERVGVPWLGWSCGECEFCREGRENLCRRARYTGYQIRTLRQLTRSSFEKGGWLMTFWTAKITNGRMDLSIV